jgi:hypothetical protein
MYVLNIVDNNGNELGKQITMVTPQRGDKIIVGEQEAMVIEKEWAGRRTLKVKINFLPLNNLMKGQL